MNNLARPALQLSALVALATTIFLGSAGNLFPTLMQQATQWQVEHIEQPTLHPAITIINWNTSPMGKCGTATWDRTFLAHTITALSQAEAKVIAPMLPIEGQSTLACGGAAADATLIEATALSGRVIYPTSAFSPLKDQALGNGHLDQSLAFETTSIPFGLAMAQAYDPRAESNFSPWALSPVEAPESTYAFDTIGKLIQDQQWTDLRKLVNDKIVILIPEMSQTTSTQIQMLHNALTNSWLHPIGAQAQVFLIFIVAFSTAWMLFIYPNWKGYSTPLGIFLLCIAAAVLLQIQWRTILPLFGVTLALATSVVSVGFLKANFRKDGRAARLQWLEKTLIQTRHELTQKEKKVCALSELLNSARLAEQQFTEQRNQLLHAQAEVDVTKHHLQKLEAELSTLRQPATETIQLLPTVPHHLEALALEAQDFGILTKDPCLLKVFSDMKKAAKSQNPILLLGETGTGKEVFAKVAHRLSDRAKRPFIPVNMAAIQPELFESELFGHVKGAFTGAVGGKGFVEAAEGGTLFLDEMGELNLELQAKLLRLLENQTFTRVGETQTRQANVRIVAATNRELKHEVEQGRFREDLYYRLRSIVFVLPALRERVPEDRRLLAQYFLEQCAQQEHRGNFQLTPEAIQTLVSYSWPGNIRELKQTLSQAVSLSETHLLTSSDLRLETHTAPTRHPLSAAPLNPKPGKSKKAPVRDDATILNALRQHGFDMGATAQDLQCDRSTITQRLKGLGYEVLVKHQGDFALAAKDLAQNESLEPLVEQKLREYEANLLPGRKRYQSVEEAITDCRRRFKNLPDRYLPAVEILIRNRFSSA